MRNDPRYKTVNHEEREALFNEYIAELRAVEHEAERAAKAKKDEQVLIVLSLKEIGGLVLKTYMYLIFVYGDDCALTLEVF